ncbi:MAG: hypothetical protein IT562_20280 [Alphaproteobacteria bacterium]|nr:hypothetical protein [Alphaproteobacteria bacterium]
MLGLAAGLAGCGEPPRPFAHEGESENPLLQVANPEGITIAELAAFPAAGEQRFLDALVAQLHRAEIPASVGQGNAMSYRLAGQVTERPAPKGVEVMILWRMADADGQSMGSHMVRQVVDAKAWRDGEAALMTLLARQSSAGLVAMLPERKLTVAGRQAAPVQPINNVVPPMGTRLPPQPNRTQRPQVAQIGPTAPAPSEASGGKKPASEPPPVALRPVEGAPGDGAEALRKAITHFLNLANVPLVSEHESPFAIIAGKIALSEPAQRQQTVRIEWALFAPGGCRMGTVSQANQIPAGKFDGPWGDAAYAVAEGAAQGLTELLDQLVAMPQDQRCKR